MMVVLCSLVGGQDGSDGGLPSPVPRYPGSLYCSIGTALKARPAHGRLQRLWGVGLMRQSGSVCRGCT